jgi:hypothetical protein
MKKDWYLSKTLWFNVLSIAGQIIAVLSGVVESPTVMAQLAVATGIINMLLRFVTTKPIG